MNEVVNSNAGVMRDCFYVMEMQNFMMMQVADDVATDGRPVTGNDGRVDWDHYRSQFEQHLEAEKALREAAGQKSASDIPEDAVVFGGKEG